MGRLVHTGLGSSFLVAHVLQYLTVLLLHPEVSLRKPAKITEETQRNQEGLSQLSQAQIDR